MQVERDQFKRYCNASIIDYLKAKKIQFESNGKEGYYHLVDHDSLVVVEEGTGHYQHNPSSGIPAVCKVTFTTSLLTIWGFPKASLSMR